MANMWFCVVFVSIRKYRYLKNLSLGALDTFHHLHYVNLFHTMLNDCIILYSQNKWSTTEPAGRLKWYSAPRHFKSIEYKTIKSHSRWMLFTIPSYFRPFDEMRQLSQSLPRYQYTSNSNITQNIYILQHLADEYDQSGLANVMDNLNRFQPDPNHSCTMAVISPFTGRLELVTVPCEQSYNISSLICLKKATIGEKVVNII